MNRGLYSETRLESHPLFLNVKIQYLLVVVFLNVSQYSGNCIIAIKIAISLNEILFQVFISFNAACQNLDIVHNLAYIHSKIFHIFSLIV